MKTEYRAWANGGSVDVVYESRHEAARQLLALGFMSSHIDSCDGSTEYWVPVDSMPSQWVDIICDGGNPPAAIIEIGR